MTNKMFCFQCEQTAGCSGCKGSAGVCGKSAPVANLQDDLTAALIGLAKACMNNGKTENSDRLILEGLFTTVTNVSFNEKTLNDLINQVHNEKNLAAPGCAGCASRCASTEDYPLSNIWNANEDIRSLKSLILFGIRGMAAYAYHAYVLGYTSEKVNNFFYKALFSLSQDYGMEEIGRAHV